MQNGGHFVSTSENWPGRNGCNGVICCKDLIAGEVLAIRQFNLPMAERKKIKSTKLQLFRPRLR